MGASSGRLCVWDIIRKRSCGRTGYIQTHSTRALLLYMHATLQYSTVQYSSSSFLTHLKAKEIVVLMPDEEKRRGKSHPQCTVVVSRYNTEHTVQDREISFSRVSVVVIRRISLFKMVIK